MSMFKFWCINFSTISVLQNLVSYTAILRQKSWRTGIPLQSAALESCHSHFNVSRNFCGTLASRCSQHARLEKENKIIKNTSPTNVQTLADQRADALCGKKRGEIQHVSFQKSACAELTRPDLIVFSWNIRVHFINICTKPANKLKSASLRLK